MSYPLRVDRRVSEHPGRSVKEHADLERRRPKVHPKVDERPRSSPPARHGERPQ